MDNQDVKGTVEIITEQLLSCTLRNMNEEIIKIYKELIETGWPPKAVAMTIALAQERVFKFIIYPLCPTYCHFKFIYYDFLLIIHCFLLIIYRFI